MDREPAYTSLDPDERQLIEAALQHSECATLSEFLRSAAVTTAAEVLDRAEQEREVAG